MSTRHVLPFILALAACAHQASVRSPAPGPTAGSQPAASVAGGPAASPASSTSGPAVFPPIHFGFDSAVLDEGSRDELARLGRYLLDNPLVRVSISGHTDERGTLEYNIALGDARARAAQTFLVRMGVPAAHMESISWGKSRPVAHGDTEEVWAQNRRDEFSLSPRPAASR